MLEQHALNGNYKRVGNHIEVTRKSESQLNRERGEWLKAGTLDFTGTENWWLHRANTHGVNYANEMRGK